MNLSPGTSMKTAQAPRLSPTSFPLPPLQDLPQTHQPVELSQQCVVKVEWTELALAMVMDTLVLRYVAVLHVVLLSHWVLTLAQRLLFPIPLSAVHAVKWRQPVSARRARSVDLDASRRLLSEESSARVGVCLKEVDFPESLG